MGLLSLVASVNIENSVFDLKKRNRETLLKERFAP